MEQFQHYIITRFNLRRADWTITKNSEKVLSNYWLKERFELFENFCFNSVKHQTNQNFKWLVFFDTNTPNEFREKMDVFKKSFSNFIPIYIDGMNSYLPSIIDNVNKLDNKHYIITSRLDNDDSLHKDYVKTVQSYFNNQEYMAIDFVDGYTMRMDGEKIKIGHKMTIYNPYISLIEKKENIKTVWHLGHSHWKYEEHVMNIRDKRLWLTIVHKSNKSNKFYGFGDVDIKILENFNLLPSKLYEIKENYSEFNSTEFLNIKNRIVDHFHFYSKKVKRESGFYKVKAHFAKNRLD